MNKRKKGVLLGGFWGIVSQSTMILLTLVTRNIFLRYFSVALLGYNTLFTELSGLLYVAELGLATSIMLALYKPVMEQDHFRIRAIFNLLKRVYHIIALIALAAGLAMVAALPLLVKDPIENLAHMRFAFFLHVLNHVIACFFSPYINYLAVLQKSYVTEIMRTAGYLLSAALKIAALVLTQNFLLFLALQFLGTLSVSVSLPVYIRRRCPELQTHPNARLPRGETAALISKSWKMALNKLSGTVVAYTDNIITSIFLGIVTVGYFSNYKNIIVSVGALVQKVLAPISNAVGSFATERTPPETQIVLNRLTFFCYFTGTLCCACLTGLINPFVSVWLGPTYLYDFLPSLVSFVNIYLILILSPLGDLFNISQCYVRHKYIPLAEILVNLAASLLLVQVAGLTGVVLGTSLCYLAGFLLKSRAVFREYFGCSRGAYLKKNAGYFVVNLLVMLAVLLLCDAIAIQNPFVALLAYLPICVLLPVAATALLYRKTDEFQYYLQHLKHIFTAAKGDA